MTCVGKSRIAIEMNLFDSFYFQNTLMVNGNWGEVFRVHPPNRKKILEIKRQMQLIRFLQVLPKSSWTTSKSIFESFSALGACHVTIIGGMVYKRSMIFEVF